MPSTMITPAELRTRAAAAEAALTTARKREAAASDAVTAAREALSQGAISRRELAVRQRELAACQEAPAGAEALARAIEKLILRTQEAPNHA